MRESLVARRALLPWAFTLCACGSSAGEGEDEAATSALAALQTSRPVPQFQAALAAGAARLCDLQADRTRDNAHNGLVDADPDDGGWDWLLDPNATEHSADASPENVYGATALGLWAATLGSPFASRAWLGEYDAASGALARSEVDSPQDFVFLALFSAQTHHRRYTELARERYDARVASAGSATAYAASIRESRHASGYDGLIAYDVSWLSLAASALAASYPRAGYAADAISYARMVVEDLNGKPGYFDPTDENEGFYTQGLAWSLIALNQLPRAPRALRSELVERLLAMQNDDGSWGWNAAYPSADLQSTAHVAQAFSLTSTPFSAASAAAFRAAAWLGSEQRANGGFAYTPTQESPLLDADILLALRLVASPRLDLEPTSAARARLSRSAAAPPLAAPF